MVCVLIPDVSEVPRKKKINCSLVAEWKLVPTLSVRNSEHSKLKNDLILGCGMGDEGDDMLTILPLEYRAVWTFPLRNRT